MCYIIFVNNLQNEIIKTKKIYREIFLRSQEAIDFQIDAIKKQSLCNHCTKDCKIDFNKITAFQKFPPHCRYRFWQEAALNLLETKISKDIYEKIQTIEEKRKKYTCCRCSSCCRLASSEYSYEELKQRAKNGDKFAAEFVSIFVPYKDIEEPRKIYPEYVEMLEKETEDINSIHFYYCPKLGADGLCTDYENRPDICRTFPNNPLISLPEKCAFSEWKHDVEIIALTLHALIDIIGFYKEKLKEALK